MLVSVIIPVFNAEKFLPKCIESVLNQTYQNLEIILVNDGSTDQSGLIGKKYAEMDNRFKVIHKKNGGVSSARNVGLKSAKGKYISFLDPDDWIEPYMIEGLYNLVVKHQADISICGYYKEKIDGTLLNNNMNTGITIYNQTEAINTILNPNSFKGYVWNKLFSLNLIKENNITFNEEIHFCEDLLFCCQYIIKANNIVYDPTPYYHYIVHANNASQSQFSRKKLTSLDALEIIIDILDTKSGVKLDKFKNNYMHMNISLLMNGIQEKKCNAIVRDQLKKNLFKHKIKSYSSNFIKITCAISRINIKLMYLIWKVINVIENRNK